jgi:hypothetical protein
MKTLKGVAIIACFSFASGTVGGYLFQRWEMTGFSFTPVQPEQAIAKAAPSDPPAPPKPDRASLSQKLSQCLGKPLDKAVIQSLTDKQLNDLTFASCQK